MKETQKLYLIALSAFEVLDYDRENLTVTISVDGDKDTDTFTVTPDDILDRAIAANIIHTFYDPTKGGDWMVGVTPNAKRISFRSWWNEIDPQDREMLYSSAVATMTAQGLEKLYRQLTKAEAVAA